MARPKPLPPPMTKCSLCDQEVEAVQLDLHERAHIVVKLDTRSTSVSPYREELVARPAQTVIYEINAVKYWNGGTGRYSWMTDPFFARAIEKVIANLPAGANIQYVPKMYINGDENKCFLTSLLVIVRL